MADGAAAAEGGQSFLWWLLSPLLGLGIFLIPMAVIGECGGRVTAGVALGSRQGRRVSAGRLISPREKFGLSQAPTDSGSAVFS